MGKIVVVNGSPKPDSYTANGLRAVAESLRHQHGYEPDFINLPRNLVGCIDCGQCRKYCIMKDAMRIIINSLEEAQAMLIGTPVYLDMPTAQTVAFLTRLNCMAENTKREFFKDKRAYFFASSWCSGTKAVCHSMMAACEMLGFTIEGRSTYEYSQVWRDRKIRGGPSEFPVYLPEFKNS